MKDWLAWRGNRARIARPSGSESTVRPDDFQPDVPDIPDEGIHAPADDSALTVGDLSLDVRRRTARVADREVELTAREFALAEVFLRHAGQVLSREQLLSHVWGYDFDPGSNVVDVFVRALRGKIGAERILTVRGVGYRFRPVEPPG